METYCNKLNIQITQWDDFIQIVRPPLFYLTTVRIFCHNTDLVHVNGHDRTILVILAKHSTRLPDDGSSVIRNILGHF